MRRVLPNLWRAAACALALAPVVLTMGMLLAGGWERPALWHACASALAIGAALLPGRLRMRGRAIPLRLMAVLAASALFVALFSFTDWPYAAASAVPGAAARIGCGLMIAALFVLTVRECCAEQPVFGRVFGLCVGVGLYLAAGIAIWTLDLAVLNGVLFGYAAAYLALCALLLNAESLNTGYAAFRAFRPAASVVRGNRRLLALALAVVGFVAMFDRIREWAGGATLVALRAIARLLGWLATLLPHGDGGDMAGGGAGQFPAGEAGEPSVVWQVLYYALLGMALVALAFLGLRAARALLRGLKALIGRLIERYRRFARVIGEGYIDERTRLFDRGELRRLMEESVKNAVRRITWREKRWEQMDAKEKVRFIVRSLYRKAGDAQRLRPMTIREAARHLDTHDADPEALAELYDRARYGEAPIADAEADALKKRAMP